MALFSFREATPEVEPPSEGDVPQRHRHRHQLQDHTRRRSSTSHDCFNIKHVSSSSTADSDNSEMNFFGAPVSIPSPGPRFLLKSAHAHVDEGEDELAAKPFEHEFERVQEQERSRRNSDIDVRAVAGPGPAFFLNLRLARRRSSGGGGVGSVGASGGGEKATASPTGLPVELWGLIFSFLAMDIDDDSYQPVGDWFNYALTCRAWAYLTLPLLYRTHGYGVFMPKPTTRDPVLCGVPVSRSINFHTGVAGQRMMKLWRTLLLSCFTASQPNSASRFTTFSGATLFPYINYVQNLDTRTLVMVLSEIMKTGKNRDKSVDMDGKISRSSKAARYFFAGALGAFEISGTARGKRMVVGGPEYEIQTPVWGKEVKLFVGDTALMMMDFLYPHLTHLKGCTIAELGQLRVSPPITMHHPVSLLTSLSNLNSLVISSGWMLSGGLGRAIASIRPTIREGASKFNLTILDWRFKTHYDPNYHHDDDWEDYRYTVRSTVDFFNALNVNSVSSVDLDFEVRYSRQQQGDLGDSVVIRQSRSLEALRVAHMRCDSQKLRDFFVQMGETGFAPKSLALIELCKEKRALENGWGFSGAMFTRLEALELSRFSGMFAFGTDVISQGPKPPPLRSLRLSYARKHVEEAPEHATAVLFFLNLLPSLADTLTTLRLSDTEHEFTTQTEPRRRAKYMRTRFTGPASPLESLHHLRTLVLAGDISLFLIRARLPEILHALRNTLAICDLCLSLPHLRGSGLHSFTPCTKLERLYLREWNWDIDEVPRANGMLKTEDVKSFVENGRMVGGRTVLRELGIDGGLLQVAAWQNWGEVKCWVAQRGCRFYHSPVQMRGVGFVVWSGRDPTFA